MLSAGNSLIGDYMKLLALIFALMAVVLTGCANQKLTTTTHADGSVTETSEPSSPLGPSDYGEYAAAYSKFTDNQAKQIQACVSASSNAQTAEGKAYAGAASMMCAALVTTQRFDLVKPKTWTDVADTAVGVVPIVYGLKTIKDVATTGIKNAGNSYGDNASLTNSSNRTESTTTTVGHDNTTTTQVQGTSEPTVVEVEPVIVGEDGAIVE